MFKARFILILHGTVCPQAFQSRSNLFRVPSILSQMTISKWNQRTPMRLSLTTHLWLHHKSFAVSVVNCMFIWRVICEQTNCMHTFHLWCFVNHLCSFSSLGYHIYRYNLCMAIRSLGFVMLEDFLDFILLEHSDKWVGRFVDMTETFISIKNIRLVKLYRILRARM